MKGILAGRFLFQNPTCMKRILFFVLVLFCTAHVHAQVSFGLKMGGRGRVQLDLRYEGNFNKYGDHIEFFDDAYHFSNNPARLMLNVNVKIFGK